jgi:hypothetical protein
VAAVVLLADQASKLWIQQHFAACDGTSLTIVPGWVAFAYTCNKGAAFGLLANETLLFVLIALVVIGMIVAYFRFLPANRAWLPAGQPPRRVGPRRGGVPFALRAIGAMACRHRGVTRLGREEAPTQSTGRVNEGGRKWRLLHSSA